MKSCQQIRTVWWR